MVMRRYASKQREIPISEKVKKMFRYSPSYEAQKCCSKLPLRYSCVSNTTKPSTIRQEEINCEYSSVKEKNNQVNECNDTSSWIAKLVSGIQDDDDEAKNIQKLSQIYNNSISDLPEDSKDYGQNQFLSQKPTSLFNNYQGPKNQKCLVFEKQVVVSKPIKRSIKDALIQIQLKQNKQGLRGPPVTRVNSCSKKQNKNVSKINSKQKTIQENSKNKNSLSNRSPLKQKSTNKNFKSKTKDKRNSLLVQKPKLEVKRKLRTLEKFAEKSIQAEDLDLTALDKQKNQNSIKIRADDLSLEIQTCKNSLVNSGTKSQSIYKLKNENEDVQTRKNSFICKDELSQSKQQFMIVQQHSKNLNVKNLFPEQTQTKPKQQYDQDLQALSGFQSQKRIGSIKKNLLKRNNLAKKEVLQEKKIQHNQQNFPIIKKQSDLELKYSYLSTKRQPKDITLYQKNNDQRILVQLDQNLFPSSQRNFYNLSSQRNESEKIIEKQKIPDTQLINQINIKKPQTKQIQNQTSQKIAQIFSKMKLDPSKPILEKNNLKIRGLTQNQKTELGSIITKIHYQDAKYDFRTFLNQFKRINSECALRGCLSQEKLRKNFHQSPKDHVFLKSQELKMQKTKQEPFAQCCKKIQIGQNIQIGHRRRDSQIVKRKLFEEIKRISYLENVNTNQPEQNSRVTLRDDCKNSDRQKKLIAGTEQSANSNKLNEDWICKDPYIQGPSICDIELTKREILSQINFRNVQPLQGGSVDQKHSETVLNSAYDDQAYLIERLNRKLSSYIDKNHIESTINQFNLNFSELKKHIR